MADTEGTRLVTCMHDGEMFIARAKSQRIAVELGASAARQGSARRIKKPLIVDPPRAAAASLNVEAAPIDIIAIRQTTNDEDEHDEYSTGSANSTAYRSTKTPEASGVL